MENGEWRMEDGGWRLEKLSIREDCPQLAQVAARNFLPDYLTFELSDHGYDAVGGFKTGTIMKYNRDESLQINI